MGAKQVSTQTQKAHKAFMSAECRSISSTPDKARYLHGIGFGYESISKALKRPKTCIRNYIKNLSADEKGGPKPLLSQSDSSQLLKLLVERAEAHKPVKTSELPEEV